MGDPIAREPGLTPPGEGRVPETIEGVGVGRITHHGQHGDGCPGCVVCPTCKQRVDAHDLDAILACSAFHEMKKEAHRA